MTNEIAILVLAISAFVLFGSVLGWASWQESKAARKKQQTENAGSASR